MGQFSWLDCVTEEQVLDDVIRDVYVLVPVEYGGGHIKESCYDGYGRFGGNDIYDLVVNWNLPYIDKVYEMVDEWHCDWLKDMRAEFERLKNGEPTIDEKRLLGIALACYDEDNERLPYPIKITHNPNAKYENCKPSMSDPDQGWKMRDDEEEWWDDEEE